VQLTETWQKLGPMPVIGKSINHPIVIMRNCPRAKAVTWFSPLKTAILYIKFDALFSIHVLKEERQRPGFSLSFDYRII
jgi:hypothetical protein